MAERTRPSLPDPTPVAEGVVHRARRRAWSPSPGAAGSKRLCGLDRGPASSPARAGAGVATRARPVFPALVAGLVWGLVHASLAAAATITVDTTLDVVDGNDGSCSLREAISAANTNVASGPTAGECPAGSVYDPEDPGSIDSILFQIPGPGPAFTIQPSAALPALTEGVVIDGTSQAGADCSSWPPTLVVELDGSLTGHGDPGLQLMSSGITIRGLVINRFGGDGIELFGADAAWITCNFIGTDRTGSVGLGNTGRGILVGPGAANSIVGTDGDGLSDDLEGNLISGNENNGIRIDSSDHRVSGNIIGATVDRTCGDLGVSNGVGNLLIASTAANLTIGSDGDDPAGVEGNLVACSDGEPGIWIFSDGAGITVRGNTIRDNQGDGVRLQSPDVGGVLISENSISGNGLLGIDLHGGGVTLNDPLDADSGANSLQNFPVLSGAETGVEESLISGTLESLPNAQFVIELFGNALCDPSGYGEGGSFLHRMVLTTDGSGRAQFATALAGPLASRFVTATATDDSGNTSEFSACVECSNCPVFADDFETGDTSRWQ